MMKALVLSRRLEKRPHGERREGSHDKALTHVGTSVLGSSRTVWVWNQIAWVS